jgi:phosphoglucosamine mutase
MRAMTTRAYFGTDGIRGVAGEHPMTAEFAFRVGQATGELLKRQHGNRVTVVIGTDTRRSGAMLAQAVGAGVMARGGNVIGLGIIPTPGVSYLTRALGAQAGVVVSASHNPFGDNGIKLFASSGEKLPDALESDLEALIEADEPWEAVTGEGVGSAQRYRRDNNDYMSFLLANAPYLDGLRVGLDCANGASYEIAPKVFQKIGARLDVINAHPDGMNINVRSGSTHPEALQLRVREVDLEVGVTFDGDADRALLIDRRGRLVTGDHILAICALSRGEKQVVATLMTNLGVERYLAERGVGMVRTQVGDRYVFEAMVERGLKLGGEQSGHMLFLDKAPTGDGLLTALQTLAAVRKSGRTLERWMDEIPVYPQLLRNVRVAPESKHALHAHPEVAAALAAAEAALGAAGRINLRPSGTEPLIRVMVEGPEQSLIERVAAEVASAVESASQAG